MFRGRSEAGLGILRMLYSSMPIFLIVIVAGSFLPWGCGEVAANQDLRPSAPNEFLITPNCIDMPVGRILLIRKGDFYWVTKFIKHEKRKDVSYSRYELYELKKEGIKKIREGEVHLEEPRSWHIILNLFH